MCTVSSMFTIVYLYCHPHNCYNKCPSNIWRSNPPGRPNMHAHNAVVLATMSIGSHACFEEYWPKGINNPHKLNITFVSG